MLSCYAGCSLHDCVIQEGLYNYYTYGDAPALHCNMSQLKSLSISRQYIFITFWIPYVQCNAVRTASHSIPLKRGCDFRPNIAYLEFGWLRSP